MRQPAFLDTNVFVYADDQAEPRKRALALSLIADLQRSGTGIVSLQVLQEYFVTATRKLGVPADIAQRKVALMARMPLVRFGAEDVIRAVELHRLHGVSFWDAMILHAAQLGGAHILYREDLQTGSQIGSVRIVNPFQAESNGAAFL